MVLFSCCACNSQSYQPGYTAPLPCPNPKETTIDIGYGDSFYIKDSLHLRILIISISNLFQIIRNICLKHFLTDDDDEL